MKKSKAAEEPLATYWMPPRDVGEPIACLASTYTFHAALFEDELLPRFLGLRFDNTERESVFIAEREDRLAMVTAAVFVDAAHVDGRQTTGRWSQVPVHVKGGCQHSKLTILVWDKLIRVLVASANLTITGYRKNREVAACLDFFDGERSSSRELFKGVLDFFEDELLERGQMPPGTKTRLVEVIKNTRQRGRGWVLPSAANSLPSTTFIPVTPKRLGRAGRGVIESMLVAWGPKRATSIHVMTPFIGDSVAAVSATIKELFRIARVRDAKGHLLLSGRPSEANDNQFIVNLPAWFRDEWAKAWKIEGADLSIYVIPPQRVDEKTERSLHAKSILVSCDDRRLLLMGSSNFSPHGLGIEVFNLEANLCYVARELTHVEALAAALPVDWRLDRKADVLWPAESEPLSDDPLPTAPAPPLGFQWATFNEQSGTLSISIDLSVALPKVWSIWIPGGDSPAFDNVRDALVLKENVLALELGESARAHRITYVTIRWTDESNIGQEARLPTLVDSEAELLPPEGLRSLQSADIVKCLLSGKDPVEWAAEDEDGETGTLKIKNAEKGYDLLKTLDTDAYVIYRTRRLGRAFAALSQRVLATLPTQTAMRHRLARDPVGPLMLARAIAAEGEGAPGAARAATLFALAELMLTVAYVALRVDPKDKLGLRPSFHDVVKSIDELARGFEYDAAASDQLKRYLSAVRARCKVASLEGLHAG